MINVEKKTNQEFIVTITEKDSSSKYILTLDDEYYYKLTTEKISKEELIKKSFEFLLERESKESILRRFNLKIINDYFPEYESKIRQEVIL